MSSRTERKHFDKQPKQKRKEVAVRIDQEEYRDEIKLAIRLGKEYNLEESELEET